MYLTGLMANSLVLGTQVLLVAIALYLIYSVGRLYHLALGGTAAAVAYALYYALHQGWPVSAAILFALALAMLLGLISYRLLESFTERREPLLGLLTSFALGIVIETLIAMIFGTDGKSLTAGILPTISLAGIQITWPGVITMAMGIFLAGLAALIIRLTPWGRIIRSIAEHSAGVEALGINQRRVRITLYMVASILAGFVGVMDGWHTALVPGMGFNLIILAFIALLVGGSSDIRGTIIASYVIVLIPELVIGLSGGRWSISPSWKISIVFLVAIVALAIRPSGLFSVAKRQT